MALWDIIKLGDSYILPGDGSHHTPVDFRFVMFRPFVQEVLIGKVKSCNRDGVQGIAKNPNEKQINSAQFQSR